MKRFHGPVSVKDLQFYSMDTRTSTASAKWGEVCCTPASAAKPVRFLHLSPRSSVG